MTNLERCAENLITLLPTIWKKFKRVYHVTDMPRQQLELLFKIGKNSGQPVSYYSDLMCVPKSNITVASNKLVEDELVSRAFSESDRRLIILNITQKGEGYLKIYKEQVKIAMMDRLTSYDESEIQRMGDLLEELQALINKDKE